MSTLTIPQRKDPVATAVLFCGILACGWLWVGQPREAPQAQADQPPVILIATPTPGLVPALDPAQSAPLAAQAGPGAAEGGRADTQSPQAPIVPENGAQALTGADPVIEQPPPPTPEVVYVDSPPQVIYVEVPAAPEQTEPVLTAPTLPVPGPEDSGHGSKSAPDRADHYDQATSDSTDPAYQGQSLLEVEQAAAEAHKDLPTVQFDNTPQQPNHFPMPRGAGSR